ncbi:MAG: hypothetical protein AAGD92_00845 [Pseudomonadota bacterium]
MSTNPLSPDQSLETRIAAIGADGYVTADEVLFLRRSIFADGVISAAELDALFALGARAPEGDIEWPQYFAEAAADHYLREEEPQGYLTAEEFASLKTRVMRDGGANALERLLLIKLMETAVETPKEMSAFAGEQIKAAIFGKEGGPCVSKEDVMMVRRWLFAAGGDANVAVTQNEAELLFDINDAIEGADNNPAWSELFVQGVVNHLMASLGYSAPSRAEAFRRYEWVSDHSVEVGGFFGRMFTGVASLFRKDKKTVYEERAEERSAAAEDAETVTPEEAEWLANRIGRDGEFDDNERKLIERMKDLNARLPEGLQELVKRAA